MNFKVTGGSIPGSAHVRTGKANQDAYRFVQNDDYSIGLVCDGCSDGEHSEVGAQIGAHLLIESIQSLIRQGSVDIIDQTFFWERVRSDVLAQIRVQALSMGRSFSTLITDFFLFTVTGCIISPELTVFFSVGDGTILINGILYELGPFPGNAPPYLAYGLSPSGKGYSDDDLNFRLQIYTTESIDTLLVGTDGCLPLVNQPERIINGRTEQVGTMDQFWSPEYMANPSLVTRRLRIINSSTVNWQEKRTIPGWLQDDVTMVTARRSESDA